MKSSPKGSLKRGLRITKEEAEEYLLEMVVDIVSKSGGMILKGRSGKIEGVHIEK